MGDKKKEPYKGGQVGKPRENASPTGWYAPRSMSKTPPTDARSGTRASGADPKKHPDRISRIIAKLTGRDKK